MNAFFSILHIFSAWWYVETTPVVLPAERSDQIPREMIRDGIFIPPEYRDTIRIAAERYRIPFNVFARLGYSESWLDPRAVRFHKDRRQRDLGMWQFNSKWLAHHRAELGDFDPMNVEQATEKAAKKFRRLYDVTGSWYDAALSWKCGVEGRKDAGNGIKAVCRWIAEGTKPFYRRY